MKEVKTVTKIYTLRNYGGGQFIVNWCGQSVRLEFIAGRGAVGSKRSVLTVTDKFTQDAIEHDPRFGRLITLDTVYGGEDEESKQQESTSAPQGKVRYTKKELEAMRAASAQTEETPAEAPKDAKKKSKAKAEQKEQVESVKTLNDAYDYFAEKGIAVENKEQLEDAMQKANVAFPNLK